jgi:hypothetical protein
MIKSVLVTRLPEKQEALVDDINESDKETKQE